MGFSSGSALAGNKLPGKWEYTPPAGIRIVDVRDIQELESHADAWTDLLLQSAAPSPMLSYPWISAFFETKVLPMESWLCLFAYEGDRLIGLLPLIAAKSHNLPGCSLLFLKTPVDFSHTNAVDCLTLRGREDLIEVFIDYMSCLPRVWPVIRMRQMTVNSSSMIYLQRPQRKLHAVQEPAGGENHIPLRGTYEEYLSGLSSSFRRQLKRRTRKLEQLEDVRFLLREDTRSVEENATRFIEVEHANWKGKENSSLKAVSGDAALHALAAERFSRCGWMEWNFLEVGSRTIAGQYAVRINRTLYVCKIGYDEEYGFCTPGNLLFNKVIEHSFEMGDIDEINCIAVCSWHKNWGMTKRPLFNLLILPRIPVVSALLCMVLRSGFIRKLIRR